jgi:ribosomal protein S18 acetylase RimI-like enzyme
MKIRNAEKNDVGAIAELMYSSGADMYDFVYKTHNKTALDYIRYEYKTGRGFVGYKNVTVAVKEGCVVGTGCFYDGKIYGKLILGTLINMFMFYGPFKFNKMLNRSIHMSSIMKKPRENEMYLSNFGVSEKYRSKGIGSAMLEKKIAEAKKAKYKKFILDVSDKNPKAEALYKKHGMVVTKKKIFTGQRDGFICANTKQMELVLND